ncbi:hypothetical protein [Mycolicibacterium sp. PDY-3]|uniref:hypothetical protein n=1 Tax=Mycolicibacterium sp. PDY-3 TaxID=3376069 RepID=UPI0037AE3DEE
MVLGDIRAGEYAAVVLDVLEHAAFHRIPHIPMRSELLDAIEASIDEIALDELDAQALAEDLPALRSAAIDS